MKKSPGIDMEMEQFKNDLLQSVKEMKQGKMASLTRVALSPVAEVRVGLGLSQAEFAAMLDISVRTVQDWEQRRREPTGPAKTLLRVATKHPEVLLNLAD